MRVVDGFEILERVEAAHDGEAEKELRMLGKLGRQILWTQVLRPDRIRGGDLGCFLLRCRARGGYRGRVVDSGNRGRA